MRDVTEEQTRTDALLAERSRTAFLARAGSRLGLSLHRDQTLRATTTCRSPTWPRAVVLHRPSPPAEDRPHWIRYAAGDAGPVTGVGGWDLATPVPGLAEALDGDATEPARGWTPSWPTWPRYSPTTSAGPGPC